MEIKIKAPAKINLTLEVLGKRPDGYHELATVMQAVDLYDIINDLLQLRGRALRRQQYLR